MSDPLIPVCCALPDSISSTYPLMKAIALSTIICESSLASVFPSPEHALSALLRCFTPVVKVKVEVGSQRSTQKPTSMQVNGFSNRRNGIAWWLKRLG